MRTKLDDKTREQLKKLRQVPVEKIRRFMTPIINIQIGDLSEKDSHRALYVLSSTLINVREQTNKLVEIFDKRENEITKLIEKYEKQDSTNHEELMNDLKELAITRDNLNQKMAEATSNQDSQKE